MALFVRSYTQFEVLSFIICNISLYLKSVQDGDIVTVERY